MTDISTQDLDSFIRLQKEKLNRERNGSKYITQTPMTGLERMPYNLQPQQDDYMNRPRALSQGHQQQELSLHQQAVLASNRQQQAEMNEKENFFDRFGSYENKKNRLKNELSREYNQYLNDKRNVNSNRRNDDGVSSEFYATLPLKGMQERDRHVSSNFRSGLMNPGDFYVWPKNLLKEPDIKPYSKHSGSQDNLASNVQNYSKNEPKSRSYFDVSSFPNGQRGGVDGGFTNINNNSSSFNALAENLRALSANSLRPTQLAYDTTTMHPAPPHNMAIDPTLTEILRRPPVGMSPMPVSSILPLPQNVLAPSNPSSNSSDALMMTLMMQQQKQQAIPPSSNRNFQHHEMPRSYSDNFTNIIAHPNSPVITTGGPTAFNFTEDQNKDSKQTKAREYQKELQRQVREKQMQKQREKQEQELLDRKILVETANFNPFGRGGGGAPLKDREGNNIANLSQAKNAANVDIPVGGLTMGGQYSPRSMGGQPPMFDLGTRRGSNEMFGGYGTGMMPPAAGETRREVQSGSDERSFARGGNGIFGEAKTEDQKRQGEKYKEELKKQMEEKKQRDLAEKEKIRLEEEKEQRRFEEEQRKIKAELENEERKKREKEDAARAEQERAKMLAEERRRQALNPKPSASTTNSSSPRKNRKTVDDTNKDSSDGGPASNFRSDSPPVPAIGKKMSDDHHKKSSHTSNTYVSSQPLPPPPAARSTNRRPTVNSTADYYNTESRLNVSSPNRKNSDDVMPKKPMLRKIASRPSSQNSSGSELITNLQNLKKHLHSEQIEVENQLYNSNNRTTVGQLSDLKHKILNIKTPPSDSPQKTYRKDTTPRLDANESNPYFRDDSGHLLGKNDDLLFSNDLQREANERQMNRLSMLNLRKGKPTSNDDVSDQLANQNNQRLKKLRDIEADNLSMADPNEVLDKFVAKSTNRHPSATTLHDDTWLRQPPA